MIGGQLAPETATLGLAIGLVLALVCYLTTNLSPGGMITPGWLALTLIQDYRQVLVIAGVTLATIGLVKIFKRVVILYGKRLFAAVVLIGVLIQLSLVVFVQRDFPLLFVHQTLGFVVPGLMAHQMERQRATWTLLATAIVTAATYAIMISGVLVGVIPAA
jgi:poly-gamma-glutamate biosynthesis protein PgsC/CapC